MLDGLSGFSDRPFLLAGHGVIIGSKREMPVFDENDPKQARVKKVLTRRRRKFAQLMAQGLTQRQAYEGAFNCVDWGSPKGHAMNGHKVAKLPEVEKLIRELEEEMCPIGDLRAEQENVLSHIKAMAFDNPDVGIRLRASIKLYELLEIHRQTQLRIDAAKSRPIGPTPIDTVVTELLELTAGDSPIMLDEIAQDALVEDPAGDEDPEA